MPTRVSVIITVHQGAATIAEPLLALAAQRLPRDVQLEVTLVDDRSSDGTGERARQIADELGVDVRTVRVDDAPTGPRSARQAALDAGIVAATGETLVVLDADAAPPPDWIGAMLQSLETAEVVASPIRYRAGGPGVRAAAIAALQSVDAAYYHAACRAVAAAGAAPGLCFGGAAFRRSLLARTGTFASLGFTLTEDLAFARAAHAAGGRIAFLTGSSVVVQGSTSLRALRERAVRVAATGGLSALALTLALPVATLPLAVALALAGVLPWWLVAVRWALGAAALTAALRTTGTLRAWPAVWLYEAAASTMAVAVALRSRRAHAIEWGGVTYRRHPAVAVETVGGTL